MEKYIDLHAHTNCSDGSLTPSELIALAAEKKLAAVAVTDHDTIAGLEEALDAGRRFGIRVVPGVEVSAKHKGRSVHIVGLGVDPDSAALRALLHKIVDARRERNRNMFARLAELNCPVDPGAYGIDINSVITRGTIGRMLVEAGYYSSVREAFEVMLGTGKPGYIPKWGPDAAEAAEILHKAGAAAFIAHYHKIYKGDREASRQAAGEMIEAGADGLEVLYSDFSEDDRITAEAIAEKYSCLKSGGSDFHGKIKPGLELGTGYGGLRIPYSFLAKIDEYRARTFG